VRVRHRLIEFGLELPYDVSPTAEFPEEIRKRDRCRIRPGNPVKKKHCQRERRKRIMK